MELYVGNIPWSLNDESLAALFAPHGTVNRAKVVMDRDSGRSRGFAFVTMGSDSEGQAAIQALNGAQCEGRSINVRVAEPRQAGDRPQRREGGFGGGSGGGGNGGYGGGRDRR